MKKLLSSFLILTTLLVTFAQKSEACGLLINNDKIDTTVHGWEVKKNKNHQQPDIPQKAREIINRYNGIYVGDPDKKVVYLTIDLGYENGNTNAILDILKKNGIKATFFVVSSYVEKKPDIVDRIINEGHSIQNHTANYKHLNNLSDAQIKKEILDLHNLIESRYGIKMKYLRPPYEEWSERVLKIINDLGYKSVFWSIACVDWVDDADANYICSSVISNYHNGAIILLHSVSKNSPQAVDMIINGLKQKGFEFKVLDI